MLNLFFKKNFLKGNFVSEQRKTDLKCSLLGGRDINLCHQLDEPNLRQRGWVLKRERVCGWASALSWQNGPSHPCATSHPTKGTPMPSPEGGERGPSS